MEEEEYPFERYQNRAFGPRTSNRGITETELKTMLTDKKSSSDVLHRISRLDNCLEKLLDEEDLRMTKVVLIVKVLNKALDEKNVAQPQAVIHVVKTVIDSSTFIDKLEGLLQNTSVPKNDPELLSAVLSIVKITLQKLPNSARKKLSYTERILHHIISKYHSKNVELLSQLDIVNEIMLRPVQQIERDREDERLQNIQNDGEMDPALFRGLSIIPTEADFDPGQDLVYRANKCKGSYDNINSYLDIQFRLLRADLILPLRTNIIEYQAWNLENRRHNLRGINVYSHVRIVRPLCHDKGLCFKLSFDVSKIRLNWSTSQRLKYGALLCLSSDNFRSYRCAVVENRDPEDLKKGLVDVLFILNHEAGDQGELLELLCEGRSTRYTMVESPSYFEAYKHVLQGLQNITEDTFPFWRYIGLCTKDIDPPQYLHELGVDATYDLRPLIDVNYIINENDDDINRFSPESQKAAAVCIQKRQSWPCANDFNLDFSQFAALQSALTKEFSIIQGPPGTGKTFIGLMVMKALLHNKQAWIGDENQRTPILLVCYTNHALDQFLEEILKFFKGTLVRVGSRSKSEALEEYNLRSARNRARENRNVAIDIHQGKREVRLRMKELKVLIHREAAKLEMLEREIVTEFFLEEYIEDHLFKSLNQNLPGKSVILNWLRINCDNFKLNQQRGGRQAQSKADGQNVEDRDINGAADERDEEQDDDSDGAADLFDDAETLLNDEETDDEDDIIDDEDNVYFAEILEGLGADHFENVRRTNKLLDEVDRETERLRQQHIAFNISAYGEEKKPPNLTKEEKVNWKKLVSFKKKYRMLLLGLLQKTDMMDEMEAKGVDCVWRLPKRDRWRLYRRWVDLYCKQLRGEIRDQSQTYGQMANRYQEILRQEDQAIMRNASIIGMTTTGAAKYQAILQEIGPKIVIVEEAAEVLEGHVVTALSAQCQHVILIGDHKQLRPNPSVYKLKKDFGLDISLFERLVRNEFPFLSLHFQHRMRPEISRLFHVPDLYPNLKDHEEVNNYPHVKGVDGDICFIYHTHHEEQNGEDKTFQNPFEANFLINFCDYLLKQGYKSTEITILSPYAGQVNLVRNLLKSMAKERNLEIMMKGLSVTSVDNYQGEENNIVLLSLVRSNQDDDIGFLKTDNRICVALSRAKIGLYVIGNLYSICEKSILLKDILNKAGQDTIKESLTLVCAQHPGERTIIWSPENFKDVPEGGCLQPCGFQLDCGHVCPRVCHADDIIHKHAVCDKPCGHHCESCNRHCSGLHRCGKHDKCHNLVKKYLPTCGHNQDVPCYLEPNQVQCHERCKETLPCGHKCKETCGSRHAHLQTSCQELVKVTPGECGHGDFQIACGKSQDDMSLECTVPCGVELECGHYCPGTCGQCRSGRLHVSCESPCKKILICGHNCRAMCNNCPPCKQPCERECFHTRCLKTCGEPCIPCLEHCAWECRHEECSSLCCQPCERSPCEIPCNLKLPCGHNCCGLCGEECPRQCAICQKEELLDEVGLFGFDGDPTTLLVGLGCGHAIEVTFMDGLMSSKGGHGADDQVIGLKRCPVCQVPVLKCFRYNREIKEMLCLIESVKRKYIGEKPKMDELKQRRDQLVRAVPIQNKRTIDTLLGVDGEILSETLLEAQCNQVEFFTKVNDLQRVLEECRSRQPERIFCNTFKDLEHFKDWILQRRDVFSKQNMIDAEKEYKRLFVLIKLHVLETNIIVRNLRDTVPVRLMILLGNYLKELSKSGIVDQNIIGEGQKIYEELKILIPACIINISITEKIEIVRAMNLQKGSWYKCANGHIYAIGECGQAAEESTCPECKSRIGGTNHQLNPSNTWAPEMDNATIPIGLNRAADFELAQRLHRELND